MTTPHLNTICSQIVSSKKSKKKKNGFSILEVLIAVGLLSLMSLGLISMLETAVFQQRKINAKDQQREASSRIRSLLSDETACLNTMGGQNPIIGFTITNLKDKNNVTKISTTAPTNVDNSGLFEFLKFSVKDYDSASSSSMMIIEYRTVGKTLGPKDSTDRISIFVRLDAGNNITYCLALGKQTDSFWKSSPLNSANIYFGETASGFVGIGTQDPASKLEVVFDNQTPGLSNDFIISRYENTIDWSPVTFRRARGTQAAPANLQYGDFLGGILDFIYVNNTFQSSSAIQGLYVGNGTTPDTELRFLTSNTQQMVITSNGNVGIGVSSPTSKLEVSGYVRPGPANPGAACSSVGAQAYDTTTGQPLYCKAGVMTWTAVSGLPLNLYKCPWENECMPPAPHIGGDWRTYGCMGQISSANSCTHYWWNHGIHDCSWPCTPL